MWIDTYGNQDPPEVTLNIYFVGRADRPELARTSDETAEDPWFNPRDIPMDHPWRSPTWKRRSATGPSQETVKARPSPICAAGWRPGPGALGHLAASIKSPRVVTDFDSGFRRPSRGI